MGSPAAPLYVSKRGINRNAKTISKLIRTAPPYQNVRNPACRMSAKRAFASVLPTTLKKATRAMRKGWPSAPGHGFEVFSYDSR